MNMEFLFRSHGMFWNWTVIVEKLQEYIENHINGKLQMNEFYLIKETSTMKKILNFFRY